MNQNIWTIIEEALREQGLGDDTILKMKSDLEELIAKETTVRLLENLTPEQKEQFKNQLVGASNSEEQAAADFIKSQYDETVINEITEKVADSLMKDYLENFVGGMSDEQKQKILSNIVSSGNQQI
jgi:hypothetical protein